MISICDAQSETRTIIHTPGLSLNEDIDAVSSLTDVGLVYIDTRHAHAAKKVCEEALLRSIPILLDVEHERGLGDLVDFFLGSASYIVSSGYVVLFYLVCLHYLVRTYRTLLGLEMLSQP